MNVTHSAINIRKKFVSNSNISLKYEFVEVIIIIKIIGAIETFFKIAFKNK